MWRGNWEKVTGKKKLNNSEIESIIHDKTPNRCPESDYYVLSKWFQEQRISHLKTSDSSKIPVMLLKFKSIQIIHLYFSDIQL